MTMFSQSQSARQPRVLRSLSSLEEHGAHLGHDSGQEPVRRLVTLYQSPPSLEVRSTQFEPLGSQQVAQPVSRGPRQPSVDGSPAPAPPPAPPAPPSVPVPPSVPAPPSEPVPPVAGDPPIATDPPIAPVVPAVARDPPVATVPPVAMVPPVAPMIARDPPCGPPVPPVVPPPPGSPFSWCSDSPPHEAATIATQTARVAARLTPPFTRRKIRSAGPARNDLGIFQPQGHFAPRTNPADRVS
jgi:hypothetical protein